MSGFLRYNKVSGRLPITSANQVSRIDLFLDGLVRCMANRTGTVSCAFLFSSLSLSIFLLLQIKKPITVLGL